ncbi:Na+/H+ antiporter NhaA [Solirubrobacter sp. CPCC 204708]|uniref:Na(+)/H(+) antiporter NhaA n=1 Tax=Solirubrobacter deserti TaxID=2282478 RepID=A0ABT4RHX4_9ACTN|nr:Na+/H+ antiporter NhaA [Solirubrobacter deserti]MBE2318771.1 Na+/H+ antiporter NhaA [Solirubrobacter deserti]MDA0138151.1 Na+/H+ antiporter NhaA [Solirubrobacter deserti]
MTDRIREFLHDEAAGGLAILAATIAALLWANLGPDYDGFWHTELGPLDLHHWVNDGLMALFFLIVGLEIKREVVDGRLQDARTAALPALAAVGGVVAPIVIFVALVAGGEGAQGWAIACATDIAFAVGLIALLGDRVSDGTRVFLLAVAIVDDIIAIAIIAVFYAEGVSLTWLLAAAALVVVIKLVPRLWLPLGVLLWIAVHESGVHATIAGVAVGLLLPLAIGERVEHRLHPWSAFVVVPLFALANAGIEFGGGALGDALSSTLVWAIVAGLVAGKLLGVSGATLAALRGGGTLPAGMPRRELYGVAAAAGIGFTVSLFIADLAFDDPALVERAKIGIFAGSLLSGLLGWAVLSRARRV